MEAVMKNKACKYTTHIAQQKTSDVMEDACAVTFMADKCMRPQKTVFIKNNSQLTIRVTMQE